MVVVQVEWLAGRTPEQKEQLVAGITDILGCVGGAQRQNVHVVLHDVPPSNWGRTGELVEPPQRGPQEEPTGGAADGVEAVNGEEEAPAARATLPELHGATPPARRACLRRPTPVLLFLRAPEVRRGDGFPGQTTGDRVRRFLDRGGAFVNGAMCGEHRRASGVTQER